MNLRNYLFKIQWIIYFLVLCGCAQGNNQVEVHWFAPFFTGGGYSSEAITFIQSLSQLKSKRIKLRIAQHGDSYSPAFMMGLQPQLQALLSELSEAPVTLPVEKVVTVCHSEPGAWKPALYQTSECPALEGTYSIGRTMFETDRLPKGWPQRMNRMQEIWVPTEFHKRIFIENGVIADKLYVVPEAVDVEFFDPSTAERYIIPGTDEETVIYLSIFKWEERKGWKVLLKAYFSAFKPHDNVLLVILTSSYHDSDSFLAKIEKFAISTVGKDLDELPKLYLMPPGIAQTALVRLYKSVNAFVLPSHGEGWGRPLVEAMSMALPVIATFWSGPTAFMTEDNSYPLQINGLVPVGEGPFADHLWADPSVEHLTELLQRIKLHPKEAQRRGANARLIMEKKYSFVVVGKILEQHLERIANKLYTRSDDVDEALLNGKNPLKNAHDEI